MLADMASSIHRSKILKETKFDVQGKSINGISLPIKFDRVERKRVTAKHDNILDAFGSSEVKEPIDEYMQQYLDVLDKPGKQERTLLHQLVEDDLPEEGCKRELLEWIVTNYPKLLLKEDENGRTALHVAAKKCGNYLDCILSQGQGQLPINRKPLELDEILKLALVKKCKTGETCLHDAVRNEDCVELLERIIELSGTDILRERNFQRQTPLHFAVQPRPSLSVIKKLIELCPEAMFYKDIDGRTPYQCLVSMGSTTGEANDILDLFKYHCIRTKDRSEVREYLYKGCEELKFEFDLSYETRPIDRTYLDGLQGRLNLRFESILAYVDLPKAAMSESRRSPSAASSPAYEAGAASRESSRNGLELYKDVFEWLWQNGVRRILEVRVNDLVEMPHKDHVIEAALKPFQVEKWNWKKLNICSDTILRAAPDVREVFLYSSGNNAVLRSWSCKHGLAQLKKLKMVDLTIYLDEALESSETVEKNAKEFASKFSQRCPHVKLNPVHVQDTLPQTGGGGEPRNLDPSPRQEHFWLEHMDKFVQECIINLDLDNLKRLDGTLIQPDVRVALIDDGVDARRQDIEVIKGTSFCEQTGSHFRDFFVAPGGHGTKMAAFIRRICPPVKLYVARLHDYESESGVNRFTARSAVEAVEWAIQQKVHIISMSWTLRPDGNNNTALKDLQNTINKAHAQNIILFSSLSDERPGRSTDRYPTCFTEVIPIGAATADGERWKWNGPDEAKFIFPGDKVMLLEPDQSSGPEVSGSSVATALASGLAALVLYCVDVVAPTRRKDVQSQFGITKVFQAMCHDSHKYTQVWNFFKTFENSSQGWGMNEQEEKRKNIEKLVEMLLAE